MRKTLIIFVTIMITGNMNTQAQNPDFLFMVEHAVKAPSGHNTQPWLFRLNESSIDILPNHERALPVVDFDNRELFISLGCALENLCISALEKGYNYEVKIADTGVISVRLSRSDSASCSPLFRQIPLRQTNRSIYNGAEIPEKDMAELGKTISGENIRVYFHKRGSRDFEIIRTYIEEGNRTQMRDKAFKEELKKWMRFNKKHSEQTNDGLSYLVFGAPNLPKCISKTIISQAVNEHTQVKSDNKKIASASHLVLFTTQHDNITEWINLGRRLQSFLLKASELKIAHSYFNQANEIRELSVKMAESLGLKGEYPSILLRIGYGKTMPYSKRRDINEVILQN